MELSPFEKQELHNIARALEEDDPRLAALMSIKDLRGQRWKRTERGVLVALGGLGILLVSLPLGSLPLGTLGFMMMGGGAYWATLFLDNSTVPRARKKAGNRHATHEEMP
ncbi:DUF3040 domain-containing protein [Paenarthrobacter sp. JL.01a]|uniref:DUF3040 domain-containing protein n=1 Tax=Paenarthrobacter sp. JL.01a TaxID=2979324 RepID=UPI0021CA2D68|nr:DUF3040 domain-containing protein [Paenarthrobacter sp. JL.01a]UXM93503.1 DUF3040 domain-containing protein [Paenarthrobacter sp. JL.01a]